MKHSKHTSHFQTKQLSADQRGESAPPTWTRCKICVGKFFRQIEWIPTEMTGFQSRPSVKINKCAHKKNLFASLFSKRQGLYVYLFGKVIAHHSEPSFMFVAQKSSTPHLILRVKGLFNKCNVIFPFGETRKKAPFSSSFSFLRCLSS